MIRTFAAAALALTLIAAGCGDDDDDAASSATTAATAAGSASTEAGAAGAESTIALADTDLGSVLVDADGMTLYLFEPDAQGESTCYDTCEENWPVLEGPVAAGEGLDAALLGTTTRTDGTVQATYNDWPLYYFAADGAAGDTKGQGLQDVWWVVDAQGEAVQAAAATGGASGAPATTSASGY